MKDEFFDRAEATKRPNGVIAIVLQKLGVRGGKAEPVAIVSCRQAGALALIAALARLLPK